MGVWEYFGMYLDCGSRLLVPGAVVEPDWLVCVVHSALVEAEMAQYEADDRVVPRRIGGELPLSVVAGANVAGACPPSILATVTRRDR